MRMMSSKDLGRFCRPNSQTNMNPKGSCLSKLSMRVQPEFPGSNGDVAGEYPSEREEISVDNEEYKNVASADQSSYEGSDGGRPDGIGRDKPMDRPKPYHDFLDEVKRQELQAEIEAWRKAEHMRLVDKLRREEAAIDDWEFKQTSKALKEIKMLESKLEKKREKAVQKTWKTISIAKEEARKKRMKVRRSTMGKISSVSLSETYDHERANSNSTKKFMLSWHKITAYCKSLYLKSVRCTAPKSQLRPS